MAPAEARAARPDQHGHVPARQPRAGRLGHQEHGDRSERRRCRRRLPQDGPGARLHQRARRDRRDQGPGAGPAQARRRAGADLPRARWAPAWRRSTRSPRRSSISRGASTSRCSPTRASPASRTGACIGHVGPEALAGGPIGKLRDGDLIRIVVDRNRLEGTVDLVGEGDARFGPEEGARVLAARAPRPDLAAGPGPPGRHAALGGAAAGGRRDLGRLRLRRGRDHPRARAR